MAIAAGQETLRSGSMPTSGMADGTELRIEELFRDNHTDAGLAGEASADGLAHTPDAINTTPQIGWLNKVGNSINNRRQVIVAGMAALAMGGGLATPAMASAESTTSAPTISTTFEVGVGSSKQKVESFSASKVVGNYATVSKAKINKAMRTPGACKTFSAKQAIKMGVQTQGYKSSGVGYAQENRRSTLCDTNKDGKYDVRVQCRNKVRVRIPNPTKAKDTIWVNNTGKANVTVTATAVANAVAICKTANTYAEAYGHGEAMGYATAKVKALHKIKGKFQSMKNEAKASADGAAGAMASAEANAKCAEMAVVVTPPNPCPPGSIKPECQPPIPNKPPTTEVDNPNHIGTNMVIPICERENDPDDAPGVNTIASRIFRIVNGGGNWVSNVYAGNDPKEFCRDYRGPSTDTNTTGQKIIISVTVTDKNGATAEASTAPFPAQTLPV